MNRPRLVLLLSTLALVTFVATGLALRRPAPAVSRHATPAPSTKPAEPLAIETIRRHALTPGPITIESDLGMRDGCRISDVSYRSDGFKVYALLTQPSADPPADGYPVLVLAHGYIKPDEYQTAGTDYQGFTNVYCGAGYAVLKPDFRGHGRSEGTAAGGHFSPDYTYDLLNLTASLPTLPGLNARRVGWLGHSMGAHVVLRGLVASHGLPVKAAVLVSGVVGSLEDIAYRWDRPELPPDVQALRTRILAQLGTPAQNPGFWHDGSAINYVAAVPAPIQIHHGDADSVVPLAFSQHLDAALTEAHKPHELFVYDGGDHQFTDPASRQLYLERSTSFLEANL